jgi:hypothetical protein
MRIGAVSIDRMTTMKSTVASLLLACVVMLSHAIAQPFPGNVDVILDIERYNEPQFAVHILCPGDFNRDGWPDLLASGDPYYQRKTFVFFGGPKILDTTADLALPGGDAMVLGDFNGDGRPDLAIRQIRFSTDGHDSVKIYYGCDTCTYAYDTVPRTILTLGPDSVYDRALEKSDFGSKLAVGDLNADGYDDLITYAHIVDTSSRSRGKIYIFFGRPVLQDSADLTGMQPTWQPYPASPPASFGGTGIKTGDVNGDGIGDLLVGSRFDWIEYYAWVDVYYGNRNFRFDAAHPDQRVDSRFLPGLDPRYGLVNFYSFLDVNNDGIDDLCTAEYGTTGCAYYGSQRGFRNTPDLVLNSPVLGMFQIKKPISDIGDVNADGMRDFSVFAYYNQRGCLLVYLGGKRGISEYPTAYILHPSDHGFGSKPAVALGDINGDGIGDYGYSSNDSHGMTYIRIMAGNRRYVLGVDDGLPARPDGPSVHAYPNPSRGPITLRFALEKREHVRASVYDVYGRVVRTIADRDCEPGEHLFAWDGRDDRGAPVVPAMYVCGVETGGCVTTTRLVLF